MANKADDFWAVAKTDYNASAENELDLQEGQHYLVIDTGDDGWWYILDNDAIDGWAPATYLEKVSPQKNIQLQREYDKKVKEDEEKRKNEITYNNFNAFENTTMSSGSNNALKNELIAKANSFAKRMKEREQSYNHLVDDQKASNNHNCQNYNNDQHNQPQNTFNTQYQYTQNTDPSSYVVSQCL